MDEQRLIFDQYDLGINVEGVFLCTLSLIVHRNELVWHVTFVKAF